jgi:negative regulator of flagellin synthesis FlgM
MKIENTITTAKVGIGDPSMTVIRFGQKAPETAASSDQVKLSAQLQDIEKKLAHGEVFDARRVEEIKQAISEGRFVVNPEKVADGLLETVRDLLRSKQS